MGRIRWGMIAVVYVVVSIAAAKAVPGLLVVLILFPIVAALIVHGVRYNKRLAANNEALFVSMFPDLQPWYHPAKLFDYAVARLAQSVPRDGRVWKDPPGFAGLTADIRYEAEREVVRLLDAAGTLLTQFIFESHPEGAAIRVGKGKFTVSTGIPKSPRVRYWHPDREFKWTPAGWQFKTPVAEGPIETGSGGTTYSSDSTSSSFTSRAASAAPFVAAGGAFDGGGSSSSWSEGAASGETSAATTSY